MRYNVRTYNNSHDCLAAFDEQPADIVIADFRMPELDGLTLLRCVREASPAAEVIMITGKGDMEIERDALSNRVHDFLSKPISLPELAESLKRTRHYQAFLLEQRYLTEQPPSAGYTVKFSVIKEEAIGEYPTPYVFGEFQSGHPPLITRLKQLEIVSLTNLNILLLGESGVGKELLARAAHEKSQRYGGNFVAINCATLPENLIESELFGYEPGAFTGANTRKPGKLALAHAGTLFLDEIAELPKTLQPKLLRALEERQVEPLGSTKSVTADFRLICATNRDLGGIVREAEFREDLYYRIHGFTLEVPPLRERRADILVLGEHFLKKYTQEYQKALLGISPAVWSSLCAHDWPGNGRELEGVIHQAVALCEGDFVDWQDLPLAYQAQKPSQASLEALLAPAVKALERQFILEALQQKGWNRGQTAKALGIDRKTLYRKIQEHRIKVPSNGA
ncbi:MAG: sigma-54 dependent transcriptional regulator [Candidatus Poribacteria bacterium]|nr:sigma-54 dependent transcriptional regulator [Candidatus Poribacteria bacterium]